MKRKRYQKFRQTSILAATAFAVFSLCPVKALAVENIMLPTQVVGDDVVSMSIPVVSDSETSVFDFSLTHRDYFIERMQPVTAEA